MKRRSFAIIIVILLLVASAEALFFAVLAPGETIRRVVIRSDMEFDDTTLLAESGVDSSTLYFPLDPLILANKIRAKTDATSVEVSKIWPGKLVVEIRGQRALVFVLTDRGDPLYVDAFGNTFAKLSAVSETPPRLLGATFDGEGRLLLTDAQKRFLKRFSEIREEDAALFSLIADVLVNESAKGAVTETITFDGSLNEGIFGENISATRLRNAILTLSLLKSNAIRVTGAVDFRTGQITYRGGTGE